MVYRVGVGLATRASGARCRPGPGGGGYGDPRERADDALRADLEDGFVSVDGLSAYGRDASFASFLNRAVAAE